MINPNELVTNGGPAVMEEGVGLPAHRGEEPCTCE